MTFQIGGINIDKLSGPTSVAILTPTTKTKYLTGRNLPVFLFLGDSHNSFQNMCTDINHDEIIADTMSKNWYNLLDSVASKEQPIDYFVESAYVLKIINQYNMFSLMWNEETNEHKPKSVMRYFDKNYLWCFASDPKLNHCFTKHIRYHFADIRKNRDSFQSLTIGDDSEFGNFDINEDTEISENDIEYLLSQMFHSNFEKTPYIPYEAWLRSGLSYALLTHRILKIGDKNMIDLLLLSTKSFSDFAQEYFDESDPYFLKYSQVYKQSKKCNIEQLYGRPLKQFVIHYFKVREKKIKSSIKSDLFEKTRETIIRIIKENKETKIKYIKDSFQYATITEIYFRDMYKGDEASCIERWISWLCSPFMDLYFLLRSWKTIEHKPNRLNQPSWLTIFQAGSSHIETLISFLVESQLYDDHCFVGTIKSSSVFQPINSLSNISSNKISRCVELKCNFNFDKYHNNANQLKICKQRIKYFGPQRYFDLLNGELISENELQTEDKKLLNLKSIEIEKDNLDDKNYIEKLKQLNN